MNDSKWFEYWEKQVAGEYTNERIQTLSPGFLEQLKESYISHGIGAWVLQPDFGKDSKASNYLDSFIWLAENEADAALLILPQAYCVVLTCSGLFNDGELDDMEEWLWLGSAGIQWDTLLRYLVDFERTKRVVEKMTPEALVLMIDWFGFMHPRARYLFQRPYHNILKKCRAVFEKEFQTRVFKRWMRRER